MKKTLFPLYARIRWLVALILALAAVPATWAGLAIPYTQDTDTMHLWHLNDSNGLYAIDSATNFTVDSATPIQLENIGEPHPGTFPYTNTSLGSAGPGYPGLANCYTGTTGQHLLTGYNGSSYGGDFPNVSQFCNPTTGAFTFEAVINLNAALSTIDAEILSGDNNGAIGVRGWQWRIEQGTEEWDLLAGSTDNDFKPALPTSGPDAAKTNTWYHVAVTFTGQSPTNGDPTNVLTLYWTLLDPSRTSADVLAQYTNDLSAPNGIRPLSGAPEGASEPALGIGGSARNTSSNPGNGEGLIGSILEVRVSDIARKSNQMAFTAGGAFPPVITQEPATNSLVGYGQLLTLNPLVTGTQPLTYEWFQNGGLLLTQTNLDLSNASPTFASAGPYYLIITNAYGSATTTVAQVTIGAAASDLFPTGIGTNGQVSAGDVPDPHYSMIQSSDPNNFGPNASIYEWNSPIEFSPGGNSSGNGIFAPTNGVSTWTGLLGNQGGNVNSSPAGNYTYRTTFLLDQVNPATVTLQGDVIFTGTITNILLNGQGTGNYLTEVHSQFIASAFTISNGFVTGLNTLDFCEAMPGAGITAIYVDQISAVGQALAPGLPQIIQQPANETVRDASLTGPGSIAEFSVIATGRPPLTYQWFADGAPVNGATNYALDIDNPTAGAQGTNYSVVIANASGSVTSSPPAMLTLLSSDPPPVCPALDVVAFNTGTSTVQISYLVDLLDSDPNNDLISYASAASSSTNGAAVNQNGATLVYTPAQGFVGFDQFTYTVQDSLGTAATGDINELDLSAPAAFTTVLVGGTTNLNAGVTNAPSPCSFRWEQYGTNLPGATGPEFVISNAQPAVAGAYALAVTDQTRTTTTSPLARVGVNGAPRPKFNGNVSDWIFNNYGTATNLVGNVLMLTDGAGSERRTAWYSWPQSISNFSVSFVYQDVGGLGADGFAFVLQNSASGTGALGGGGGGLGYESIPNSVAFEFNIYSPNTVGIALQSGGTVTSPFTPATPVNLASGDPIAVNISYSTGVAQLTLTDLTTTASANFAFDATNALGDSFENLIGTSIAYVGFTGADGGVSSTQTISNFVYMPPSLPLAVQLTGSGNAVLSWSQPYNGFLLQSAGSLTGSWQNVPTAVNAVGDQYQVVTPSTAGAQFYRLTLP